MALKPSGLLIQWGPSRSCAAAGAPPLEAAYVEANGVSRPVTAEEAGRWLLDFQRRLGQRVRRDSGTEINVSTLRVIETLIASAVKRMPPADAFVVDRISESSRRGRLVVRFIATF